MPAPPYSTGKMVPIRPSLPNSLTVSSGKVPGSSHFITLGAISRSAKSRTIFFNCSCSSESWKSKPFLQIVNLNLSQLLKFTLLVARHPLLVGRLVLLCYKKPRRQQGHLGRERAKWVRSGGAGWQSRMDYAVRSAPAAPRGV